MFIIEVCVSWKIAHQPEEADFFGGVSVLCVVDDSGFARIWILVQAREINIVPGARSGSKT
jgi:hypothetical protein